MNTVQRLRSRLRALIDRQAAERDLDDELRFHLDMETEHLMRMGLPEGEARRRARREFGGVERYRDESRDARGVGALEDFARDVRWSMRSLRRAPGFSLVSILTVALGIGTTAAVFSIIDGVLLRPLPYPRAEELVRIYERTDGSQTASFTAANFYDIEKSAATLRASAYFSTGIETVLGDLQPRRVPTAYVSDRFFDVMGVKPARGRGFVPGSATGEDRNAVVVSDAFWRSSMGGRPDWASATIQVDGGLRRVIGVMPAGFSYPIGVELWVPLFDNSPSRSSHNWQVIARLREGRSVADAQVDIDRIIGILKREHGTRMSASGVTIRTLREALTVRVQTLMLVLMTAVGLVLLIACVNLASANLARGESQHREIGVRISLGASRGRLVRQLATEKLLLCAVGGVLGIALAWALVRIGVSIGAGTIPGFAHIAVDHRVVAFGLVMALLTGLVTGVLPAMRVTSDLRGMIGGSDRRHSIRGPLIASEVALATMLLIGAGLFLRSFQALVEEDPGYRIEQAMLGDLALPAAYRNQGGGYGDTTRIERFMSAVLQDLRTSRELNGVAVVNQIPLGVANFNTGLRLDGDATARSGVSVDYRVIDSAYFGVMGIPLIRGRAFNSGDRSGSLQVVIINRAAATKLWPGANPIGRTMLTPGMDLHRNEWLTVIGVVDDIKQIALDQPVTPQMYVHYLQRPERMMSASLVVRSDRADDAAAAIRRAVSKADRAVVVEVRSLEALASQSLAGRRFSMTMLSAFSALALFLAAVGIYGILAYLVVQRQREIGVRMAIGLSRPGVARLIVFDAMRAVAPGLVIGIVGAYFATRFIQGMLYGIAPVDPVTYVATPTVILGVALLASLAPASRASRVDPMIAMRAE